MTTRGLLIAAIGLALGLIVALGVVFAVVLPKGESTTVPAVSTSAPKATATRTSAQAGPTDPAPTDTPTPTATPTPAKGIRAASGQPTTGSLAGSVPTRVQASPTLVKPTATLKPGETRQAEGQKIEVPNPLGGDPISVPIPIPGGYTAMPTVNIQLPGGATPTPTPKPCSNWFGIGCPSQQPKSDQPAPKPSAEGGEFPWLPVCGGLFLIVVIVGIVFLFRSGILSITNTP